MKIEKLIDTSDPVYTFCKVMDHIDLSRYLVVRGYKTDRPKCDKHKLLKVIPFAFMEHGISSLHDIEKLCRNDIRYLYLPDGMKTPSSATSDNFIRKELTDSIEQISLDINTYILQKGHVDLGHVYLDETKIKANADRYTWVWRKFCARSRGKVFEEISMLLDAMNQEVPGYLDLKLEKREEYTINYASEPLKSYRKGIGLEESTSVSGCGHRKGIYQKQYQELQGYLERSKTYVYRIEICGEERSSYSKTDHSTTFMRLKEDYMGDDQLLPAYNLQAAVCDEYIAAADIKPYTSDMECFVPLMEKFHKTYGCYPEHPVAGVGYSPCNDHLYCEEHGMERCIEFMIFQKGTKDKEYYENPYRAVDLRKDGFGNLLCLGGRKFRFKYRHSVCGNRCGRAEELYECESCEGCEYKSEYSPKVSGNRTIRMNGELAVIHQEVLSNLEFIRGALLRMNRSIQTEGAFEVLKWDRFYKRLFRRGEKNIILESTLISRGSNIYEYHNKRQRKEAAV